MIYEYKGNRYPDYLKGGNACQFIQAAALHFCRGKGFDIGAGKWPLKGAVPIDAATGGNAMDLPPFEQDFIFSSHCLEHLADPIGALQHWRTRLREGGVLFLYLPHPDMEYWLPQNNRKHLHTWRPEEMERILRDLGYVRTMRSERDLAWSYSVVGFKPGIIAEGEATDRFRQLIEDSSAYFRGDPMMLEVFKKFGADAFRRSSMFDGLDEFAKKFNFGGKRCVEIGTYNGITAMVLSKYFEEVVSVDIFPHTMKRTMVEHLGVTNIRFFDAKDNAHKAQIIKGVEPFDAAYIDGDHERDTETDFALVERCGRVLFHEYWEQQKPVWDLVNRLKLSGKVDVVGKLAMWTKAK